MQNKPLLIGITGGIGSGKSTVCRIFETLGIPTYYADDRAKWLMSNDQQLKASIIQEFGELAFKEGKLNRQHIASLAFHDQNVLERLNALVHPKVGADFKEWVVANGDKPYLLKEAALIFEAGSYKALDKVITVYAAEALRVERVLKRDPHRSKKDIEAIMQKQMPEDEKKDRSDYVIYNDERKSVIEQVVQLDQELRTIKRTPPEA